MNVKYKNLISIRIYFFFVGIYSTINNSPIHINEEDKLEKEIEHLERRLASAKSQLIFVTSQKTKQFKS